MNTDQLIEYIAAQVLERISKISKKKALIIGTDEDLISKSQDKLLADYDIEISSNFNLDGDYDYIVLANICTDFLASVSIGLIRERYPVIHKALMTGTPIEIVEEGMEHRKYISTCNASFYALMVGYEEKVKSFGIDIKPLIKLDNVKEVAKVNEPDNNKELVKVKESVGDKEAVVLTKKLITEQMLRNERVKGITKVQVAKGALVTPLASDYAREQSMTIIKM